jgi:hypothetical protein
MWGNGLNPLILRIHSAGFHVRLKITILACYA